MVSCSTTRLPVGSRQSNPIVERPGAHILSELSDSQAFQQFLLHSSARHVHFVNNNLLHPSSVYRVKDTHLIKLFLSVFQFVFITCVISTVTTVHHGGSHLQKEWLASFFRIGLSKRLQKSRNPQANPSSLILHPKEDPKTAHQANRGQW